MNNKRLWAPWRIQYIRAKKTKKCVLCLAARGKKKDYLLLKTKYSTALLNIYPYNNGHIMLSPIRHINDISKLKEVELLDLFCVLNKVKLALNKALRPHGFNIGLNLGRAAGAGISAHLHIHIVPRWIGDTNFMPGVTGTKVISQSLDELLKQLKKCLPKNK